MTTHSAACHYVTPYVCPPFTHTLTHSNTISWSCGQTVQIRCLNDAHLSGLCPNHFYAERGPQCLRKTSGSMAFCGLIWTLHPAPPPLLNQHVMAQEHEHWSPTSVMMCEGVCVCVVVCCFNVCVADLLQNWQAPEAIYKNAESRAWGRGWDCRAIDLSSAQHDKAQSHGAMDVMIGACNV